MQRLYHSRHAFPHIIQLKFTMFNFPAGSLPNLGIITWRRLGTCLTGIHPLVPFYTLMVRRLCDLRRHVFFLKILLNQGPFCEATSILCFGLQVTLPMDFDSRVVSSFAFHVAVPKHSPLITATRVQSPARLACGKALSSSCRCLAVFPLDFLPPSEVQNFVS